MCKYCEENSDKNKKLKVDMRVETKFGCYKTFDAEYKTTAYVSTVLHDVKPNYCPYCGTKLKEIEPL